MTDTPILIRSRHDVTATVERDDLTGRRSRLVLAVAFGCIFLDAYDFGAVGVGAAQIREQFHLSAGLFGAVTAAVAVGALVGGFLGGYFVDRVGRLKMFAVDLVFFVGATIGAALSPDPWVLIVCRFLIGIGVGLDFPVAMSFIAEYRGGRRRAGAVSSWGAVYMVGTIATYLVGMLLNVLGVGDAAWRIVLAIGILPAVAILILRHRHLQESPLWTASQGDLHAAARILERSYGVPVVVADDADFSPSLEHRFSLRDYATVLRRPYLKRTVVASLVSAMQSLEFYAVTFYLPIILLALFGDHPITVLAGGALFALINGIGGTAVVWVVPWAGVRRPLAISAGVAAVSLLVLGIGYGKFGVGAAAVLIGVFHLAHGFGPGPLGRSYSSLSFPTALRGSGVGVVEGFNRFGSIVGFFAFPVLLDSIGLGRTLLCLMVAPVVIVVTVAIAKWEPVGSSVDDEAEDAADDAADDAAARGPRPPAVTGS
jgi:MFS family permease